ncbi:MAG: hypothetical protein AAF787_09210 [Chloroflexota bacterium]
MSTENGKSGNSIFYPLLIIAGIIGSIVNFMASWQALVSALGIFFSTLVIGVGVIGVFVNQKRIDLQDGILYSVIWTLLIALAGAGYYIIITRPVVVTGVLLDNNTRRDPVVGIEVVLHHLETGNLRRVVTRDNGTFEFNDVTQGEFDILIDSVALSNGRAPGGWGKLISNRVDLQVLYLNNINSLSLVVTQAPATKVDIDTPTATLTLTPTASPTNTVVPTATSTPPETPEPLQGLASTDAATLTMPATATSTNTALPTLTSTVASTTAQPTLTATTSQLGQGEEIEADTIVAIDIEAECRIHAPRLSPALIYREPDLNTDRLAVVGDQALGVKAIFTDSDLFQWWILDLPIGIDGYVAEDSTDVSDGCLDFMLNPPEPVQEPSLTVIQSDRSTTLYPNLNFFDPDGARTDLVYRDYKLHILAQCGDGYLVERPWNLERPLWIQANAVELDQPDAEIPVWDDCDI